MAGPSAIDKLKDKPKDQRVAIAEGFAITVVVILMVAWAVFFFKKIQNGTQNVQLGGGAQDQFNFSSVKEAQDQLKNTYGDVNKDLQELRSEAQSSGQTAQQQTVQTGDSGSTNQFSNPTTGQ